MSSAHQSKASSSVARTTRDRCVDAGFHVSVALLGVAIVFVVALAAF
jgi:hypothetical protein